MGALHSPVFLMRNGIGPAKELAALGIDVVADRRRRRQAPDGASRRQFRLLPQARRAAAGRTCGGRCSRGCAGRRSSTAARQATCTSSRPTRRRGTASATGSACIMMWVNRSYSTGEVRLTSPDPVGQARHRFQHVLGLARHGAHDHGRAHDDQAAGASGDPAHLSRRFSRSATATARANTRSTAARTRSRWRSAAR